MTTVKRIRFKQLHIDFYRDKVKDISFQKFVENAMDNEVNRYYKKRLKSQF